MNCQASLANGFFTSDSFIMENIAYLLLGGNVGKVGENLAKTRELIQQRAGKVIASSGIYQTQAWGFESDALFLNQALCISTPWPPVVLLEKLLETEAVMGRKRTKPGYESRVMDIDILFFNEEVIQEPGLIVPHPRMHLRNFALLPMLELAPQLVHPVFNKTIQTLTANCSDTNKAIRLD